MIHGVVAGGFEGVGEAFERCFDELGETGARYVAIRDGRAVADLWGGEGLDCDSLVHVYSVTKPMAAFCVLVLVDRGVLALDEPVARWWPEFAQAGKGHVTIRQALSHQAGLVALREQQPAEVLFDWECMCGLIAAERPWWQPGAGHGEHALFYGHICGELVRRTDGRSLGSSGAKRWLRRGRSTSMSVLGWMSSSAPSTSTASSRSVTVRYDASRSRTRRACSTCPS